MNEIKRLRLIHEWSLRTLAKRAKLSVGVLVRLERGESLPNEVNLFKLAGAFGIEPEVFIAMAKQAVANTAKQEVPTEAAVSTLVEFL